MENQLQIPKAIAKNEQRDIEVVTTEIKSIVQQAQTMALMYAIEIGRRLKEAKSLLPHGEWGNWLKDKVNFSQSSANNFMRIFEEYGDTQFNFFGVMPNSQTLGNLPYTKALQLIAIPEEERENFVKENDVEKLSTRELDKIIKERGEALKQAEKYKQQADAAEEIQKQFEAQKAAAEESNKKVTELNSQLANLKQQLEKSKEAEKKAKANYKELKNNPVIPQETLDSIKAEAESKASEEITKQIQANIDEANKKIAEVIQAKKEAERKAKEAADAAEAMRKKLEMSNPDIIAFKTIFEQTQENMHKLQGHIEKIRLSDNATADKLNAALNAFIKQCEQQNM